MYSKKKTKKKKKKKNSRAALIRTHLVHLRKQVAQEAAILCLKFGSLTCTVDGCSQRPDPKDGALY